MEELDALMTIWNAGAPDRERNSHSTGTFPAGANGNSAGSSGSSSGIKLSRVTSSSQRSSSAANAAAVATASITRNSLANAGRPSGVNLGQDSTTPGSTLSSAPIASSAGTVAASQIDGGRGSAGHSCAAAADTVAGGSLGGSGSGMIGRICMTKASAGLVLDEKRLKELMAGGGLQVSCQQGGDVVLCWGLLQHGLPMLRLDEP